MHEPGAGDRHDLQVPASRLQSAELRSTNDASASTSEERAEDHVAGRAREAVEVEAFSSWTQGSRGEHGRTEPVIDVRDGDSCGTGVEHREQRGETLERSPVTDTCRHRDDGGRSDPSDQARQARPPSRRRR